MKAKYTEKEFLGQVMRLAGLRGWKTAHFRPGMMQDGRWVTPVAGDGAGFPDLILVRDNVLLALELKVGRNKPTPEQLGWLEAFGRVAAVSRVVRPEDWDEIERMLM